MQCNRNAQVPWTPILLVIAVVVFAVASRLLGAGEQLSAGLLVTGTAGVLVARAAQTCRPFGGRFLAAAFASIAAAAAVAPALLSIFPGRPLLSATLEHEGSSVAVPPGIDGAVRVLVSSDLEEKRSGYIAFALALGGNRVEGSLEHGVRRVGSGEDVRHYHVRRVSVYLESRLGPGDDSISVSRLSSASPSPLRIDVYRRVLPMWAYLLLALGGLSMAGVVEVITRTPGRIAPAAGAALASGLLSGWTATPNYALWPAIVSLAMGSILGVAAGLATSRIGRWSARKSHAGARH